MVITRRTPRPSATPPRGARPGSTALRWAATALAFPVGGLLARLPGPVDSVPAALLAGGIAGAVLGAAQAVALGRPVVRVAAASAAGVAGGLALGGAAVSFGTTLPELAVQGLVTGAVLGAVQLLVLRPLLGALARLWPPLLAVAWAAGWATTTAAGVDVGRQYAVFGATGALVATALTGLVAVPAAVRTARRAVGRTAQRP